MGVNAVMSRKMLQDVTRLQKNPGDTGITAGGWALAGRYGALPKMVDWRRCGQAPPSLWDSSGLAETEHGQKGSLR